MILPLSNATAPPTRKLSIVSAITPQIALATIRTTNKTAMIDKFAIFVLLIVPTTNKKEVCQQKPCLFASRTSGVDLLPFWQKTCVEFFAKIVAKQRALCLQNIGKTNENFLQLGGKKCYRKPCVLPCIGRQGAEILLQNRLLKWKFSTLPTRVCKLAHFWVQGATFGVQNGKT